MSKYTLMDHGVFSGDVFVRNAIGSCPPFSVNTIYAKGEGMQKLEDKECDWQYVRLFKPNPKCEPAKWKVKVAMGQLMFSGKTLYLCDYHKKNLLFKFEKVEKL